MIIGVIFVFIGVFVIIRAFMLIGDYRSHLCDHRGLVVDYGKTDLNPPACKSLQYVYASLYATITHTCNCHLLRRNNQGY